MATFWYNEAAKEHADQTLDLLVDTIKWMLVNSVYVPDRDDKVVDAGGASDPVDAEISVTNYIGGWGGSGRKALTGKAITVNDAADRAEFDCDDPTWTALGNGVNDTVVGAIAIKEGGASDLTSRLIAYFDFTDKLTNGTDFKLVVGANGLLWFATT